MHMHMHMHMHAIMSFMVSVSSNDKSATQCMHRLVWVNTYWPKETG